jgi:ferredoxin-type protein NapH
VNVAPRYTRWRRAAQLVFLLVYLALPFTGATCVSGTLAALKIGAADLVEPAAALSAMLAARTVGLALLLGVAPVVLLAVVLGPVYCSWVCPFGLLSEAIDRLRRRGRWTGRPWVRARRWRLASLAAFAVGSTALGLPLAAILAPPRLATALPLEARVLAGLPSVTTALLLAALVVELAAPRRLICRALCPAGGIAALLRTPFTMGPTFDRSRCRCGAEALCLQTCPWGVDPREMRLHDGCTTCLACVERCPSGALALRVVSTAAPAPTVEQGAKTR